MKWILAVNTCLLYTSYDDFRGIQKEIIESIGNGHDTLGLMPTGGGKSITFQVPALAQPGFCLLYTSKIRETCEIRKARLTNDKNKAEID